VNTGATLKVMIVFSAAGLGGAERSLSRMALANDQAEISYLFSTLGGDGAWAEWIRQSGQQPLVFSLLGRLPRPAEFLRFIATVRNRSPRVIYVVGVRAAVLVRLLKPFLGGVKIVHGIRTTFERGSSLARTFGIPERLFQHCTDCYIANSNAGAETLSALSRIPRSQFHVIPNGVSIPCNSVPPITERPDIVAVVANIHRLKGHREFMKVVELVHRARPRTVFNFIGEDSLNGEIKRTARSMGLESAVSFAGFQPDVWSWLVAARLFVLPSRNVEGAPTSILEAQGAALPVVAFAIGGIPDIVRDGVDGCLITPGDDHAMARTIVSLLDEPPRSAAMGQAGREKVLNSFTLQASARRHAQVWRELLSGRNESVTNP
jgi:glycosyltransferase involved in cell wall biosynthesis